jgi:hypothetical protein
MGQIDSTTRSALASNQLHGLIDSAAGGGTSAQGASQSARGVSSVINFGGNGMSLDSSSRSARANTDAQGSIQANMNDPAAATAGGARAAYAASFPSSHQW